MPRGARESKKNIPFETQTGTGQNSIAEIPSDGAQGILLHHASDGAQLLEGLLVVGLGDEGDALVDGQVGPVDALGRVAVIGMEEIGEDGLLIVGVVSIRVGGVVVASFGAVRDADNPLVGGVVMFVVMQKVRHCAKC